MSVAALAMAFLPQDSATAAAAGPVTDPAALVNPLIGTGSGGDVVGQVDTFPGAVVPFGMVQWSPDTSSRPPGGGYNYADSSITGLSLTHVSGPGCAIAGDFPVLPLSGAVPADPASAQQPFSHASESATPGAYSVTLAPGTPSAVGVRLSATTRTGLAEFSFPATDQAHVLVKSAGSAAGSSAATFAVSGDREISGSVASGHFCGQPNSYTVYFAARFDRPFTSSASWAGGTGGTLTFDTRHASTVRMQVGISYTSAAGARRNLAAEATSWSVSDVARAAHNAWNQQLRKIEISGGTAAEQASFYTALYHTQLDPNVIDDADGSYPGFDGKTHTAARDHHQYSDFSGWDVYRSETQLIAMLDPQRGSDMARSLLADADQGGWLPKWPSVNGYTGVMNGDAADPMLADLYAFGARDFDVHQAVAAMVHGAQGTGTPGQGWYVERPHGQDYIADGYVPNVGSDSISPVPNGASETEEYAVADFAISRLAQAGGDAADAGVFLKRSQNWASVFNTATGYIQPRDAGGAFPSGDPVTAGQSGFGQSGFQEGNTSQYTWMVPQNLRALFDGMGGDAAVRQRLDTYFTQLNVGPNQPYHWQGNEPAEGTPWAYDSAGAPWETQRVVRQIVSTLYAPTPGGEPGNDDLGAMSSWYVWATLGLYPQTPGVPMLALGAPLFTSEVIHAGANTVTVKAPQAGDAAPYIQALKVDGRTSQHAYLMLDGRPHHLDYSLGAAPNQAWGSAPQDAPPSFSAGPVSFPPSTRAAVTVTPQQVRVAPGETTQVAVKVDNTLGSTPATVTWTAQGPAGLTATPSQATVTIPAGGAVSTAVALAPAAAMASGYYQVAVQAKASNGAAIPTTDILATVAAPGVFIPTAYVTNYSDGTLTPVDIRTGNAGPPIPVGSGPDGEAITPDGKRLFVANNNTNNVTVIDTTDNHVIGTVTVGNVAADVAATPDGKTVWVSDFSDGTVQPIDVATLTAGTPVKVGSQAERVAVNPAGTQLWVADQGDGTVSVVDLASRTVVHTVAVGAAPFGIAFAHDGSKAYVTNGGGNSVSVIDTGAAAVSATIPVGAGPQGIRVSPDGSVVYVADSGAGGVTPIATATGVAGPLIPTGSGAYAVGFTPDGSVAWVVDTNTNDVRPVTVATGAVGAAVKVGNVPDGIVVTPATAP
ncbi:GH92 family glycosyl hydrolase [Catenulispora acidiphila]|uniref:GH92 family glycosyl hydrolase n=1 Tax=Catenulispora acidiphila TaxID=304895 RepID=UPI00019DFA7D|nr:GH92 family glycosyl hydrolase [Catenulispora acidiphila]